MPGKYLIRFDDLCPTMNWDIWAKIESVLLEYEICPLLAVVPDNRDQKLVAGAARTDFWNEVRHWQARGWTIGLHGYQHVYVTQDAGIVGIQPRSEFAGLPSDVQEEKLRRGADILRGEGIDPEVWIAPAHSFDSATVSALPKVGIKTISDGLAIAPHMDSDGMFWVPQQLWRFRRRPLGVWTVCFHHNHWSEEDFGQFHRAVHIYRDSITGLGDLRKAYFERRHSISDKFYSFAHSTALSLRTSLGTSA